MTRLSDHHGGSRTPVAPQSGFGQEANSTEVIHDAMWKRIIQLEQHALNQAAAIDLLSERVLKLETLVLGVPVIREAENGVNDTAPGGIEALSEQAVGGETPAPFTPTPSPDPATPSPSSSEGEGSVGPTESSLPDSDSSEELPKSAGEVAERLGQ